MISGSEFRERIIEDLETGGEALEAEGFEVNRYGAGFRKDVDTFVYGDTAREAWSRLAEEVPDEDHYSHLEIKSAVLNDVLEGRDSPVNLMSQILQANIHLQDSDEKPVSDAPGPIIEYIPTSPEGYFQVGSVNPSLDIEEQEYFDDVRNALEDYGFETRRMREGKNRF